MTARPEPIRPVPLRGTWGYVTPLGVKPGEEASFHVATEAAYELSIVKLGTTEILASTDVEADRSDVEVLKVSQHPNATRQSLEPGSYVMMEGDPIPEVDITVGLWVRMWRIAPVDTVQWQWASLISDIDYPDAARFGLLVDEWGRIQVYAGDGGPLRQEWRHIPPLTLADRLGEWVSVSASIGGDGVRIHVDDEEVYATAEPAPVAALSPRSRLRLGASMDSGKVGCFLDGDLADPFILEGGVDGVFARAHHEAWGHAGFHDRHTDRLLGWWPLDEETGADVHDGSGHDRHGTLVNHGTWQIGGPGLDHRSIPQTFLSGSIPYSPTLDESRGHGLRLSSDDLVDCGWSVTDTFRVPEDADSGLYAARVLLAGQDPQEATVLPFVVVRPEPRRENSIALMCATNTWLAYGRRPLNEEHVHGLEASFYSTHAHGRPHYYVGLHAPIPFADPYGSDSRRAGAHHHSHVVRPERFAEAWLRREGYAFECITDTDLHRDPTLLGQFRTLMLAGHSEYWTYPMQDGLRAFLEGGGTVLSMSGDTMSQRVSFDASATVLEARKIHAVDHRWLTPDWWGERWHEQDGQAGGTLRSLGSPSYDLIGVSTQGMIDDGVAANFSAFTVLEPDHPLFSEPDPVPLDSGKIGERSLNGPQASGYEFDTTPHLKRMRNEPHPGSITLASALDQRTLSTLGPVDHGGDIVYWERPQGGSVLAIGSIGATGALGVDEGIAALVRNVLARFGVTRTRGDGPRP